MKRFEQGELGRVVSVTMRKPRRLNPERRQGWHFPKEQNGGLMAEAVRAAVTDIMFTPVL
ncbi:hypothetical protein [Paenibacillus sp. HJGM_3]|uniref:hypothetical protein n=1 Tax=Paenibacillus sp. HJGM_3 TaxID=3379816 RepID=UPI00385AF080